LISESKKAFEKRFLKKVSGRRDFHIPFRGEPSIRKQKTAYKKRFLWEVSGRRDLNPRSRGPEPRTLAGLSHTPSAFSIIPCFDSFYQRIISKFSEIPGWCFVRSRKSMTYIFHLYLSINPQAGYNSGNLTAGIDNFYNLEKQWSKLIWATIKFVWQSLG
jgi:hypothetical protein